MVVCEYNLYNIFESLASSDKAVVFFDHICIKQDTTKGNDISFRNKSKIPYL